MPMTIMILRVIESTEKVGVILCHIFSLVPGFSTLWGIFVIGKYFFIFAILNSKSMFETIYTFYHEKDIKYDDFEWNIGLQPLVFLIGTIPFYLSLLLIYELCIKNCLQRRERNIALPRYKFQYIKDDDVTKEEERVQHEGPQNMAICADKISKAYEAKARGLPMVLASHQVSFGVKNGEVFALLGVNGAGKTTTFRMLTNDLQANRGEVYISSKNINSQNSNVSNVVGYCPQTNVLFDFLTVDEHFALYSAVKGVKESKRQELIDEIQHGLGLEPYKNVRASKLSGGTKRKLSVALAILGNPPVILLDEPSTGIDPQARRQMWNLIGHISKKWKKCAVVLTTHSMEEAEALSTRLAIMVNGTIRCIGPAQYIKNKYAIGFCIEVKFKQPTEEDIHKFATENSIQNALDAKVSRDEYLRILRNIGMTEFANKLPISAEFSDFMTMMSSQIGITLGGALKYAVLEKYKGITMSEITKQCGDTKEEYVSSGHYKFRIVHCKVSVGHLFGMVEEMVFF